MRPFHHIGFYMRSSDCEGNFRFESLLLPRSPTGIRTHRNLQIVSFNSHLTFKARVCRSAAAYVRVSCVPHASLFSIALYFTFDLRVAKGIPDSWGKQKGTIDDSLCGFHKHIFCNFNIFFFLFIQLSTIFCIAFCANESLYIITAKYSKQIIRQRKISIRM